MKWTMNLVRNPDTLGSGERAIVARIEAGNVMRQFEQLARQAGFSLEIDDATHHTDGTPL